jgi:hypothetical protein
VKDHVVIAQFQQALKKLARLVITEDNLAALSCWL